MNDMRQKSKYNCSFFSKEDGSCFLSVSQPNICVSAKKCDGYKMENMKKTLSNEEVGELLKSMSEKYEVCFCDKKADDNWKYHETYCPVWKNGRIGELESKSEHLFNETLEVVHDLSGNNEVLKARVLELESAIQEFLEKMMGYKAHGTDGLALEAWTVIFKQLLENKPT